MNNSPSADKFQKIKLIYAPFLILAVGFIITYTFLHWLLILKFELFSIDEAVIDAWMPLILPWLPVLLFLRKRIKLLKFKDTARDPHFFYIMIAAIAIAAPTIIAQGYIRTATGQLSKLASSLQIDASHLTKYYNFENTYFDRRFTGVNWFVDVVGKHNETMVFHGYFALPIMSSASDTIKKNFNTWYGIDYEEKISNRLDQSEKEKLFQEFQTSSIYKYNHENLYNYQYFDRLGANDEHKGLLEAVKLTPFYDGKISPIILKPVHEAFELRNGKKFGWIFKSFAIGGLIWLIMILLPSFNESALKNFLSGKPTSRKVKIKAEAILQLLIPRNGFFVTTIIIELNILIFTIMVFTGFGFITFNGNDLLNWGANYRPFIMNGEYWRLFTATFLHGGLMHIMMNMYALFFVGIFLEPVLGSKRFGLFYVITGILASLASVWWHEKTVSVGASGAIFGMYGIFLSLLLTRLFPKDFKKSFLLSTAIFISYNFIIGLTGGIDNAAHIGGLLSGMVVGAAISQTLIKEKRKRRKSENRLVQNGTSLSL